METFAIITTEPNELLVEKTGHDRMPVIVKSADYQRWLQPGPAEHPPLDLIRPFDKKKMKAWRVDQRINGVRNNDQLWVGRLKVTRNSRGCSNSKCQQCVIENGINLSRLRVNVGCPLFPGTAER